jgi:nucleoside-diphosphate-sugar epimerase
VKAFVTGATGHVGANLVRALLAQGDEVRVLLEPGADAAAVAGLDVERVEGDLRDGAALARGLAGCDRLYHLAALISLRNRDRQKVFDVNVAGTRNVLAAARQAGVRRAVHCSSFGAVGWRPGGASDEECLLDPFSCPLDYELCKMLAEHEALRACVAGLEVVIVNPSATIGPFDFRPSSFGRTVVQLVRGRMRAYIPGLFDFVPVRDVVQGHLLAMERGRPGERYLLTGRATTLDEIIDWVHELTGARRPPLRLPYGLVRPALAAKDWLEATLAPRREPVFTAQTARLLTFGKHGDNAKARRELGLSPTSVKEALREALLWYHERGWLDVAPGARAWDAGWAGEGAA